MGWIKNRINSEYKKHQGLDWSNIAEAKIISTIKDIVTKLEKKVKKEAKKSDLSFHKNKKDLFDADTECFINYLKRLKEEIS